MRPIPCARTLRLARRGTAARGLVAEASLLGLVVGWEREVAVEAVGLVGVEGVEQRHAGAGVGAGVDVGAEAEGGAEVEVDVEMTACLGESGKERGD